MIFGGNQIKKDFEKGYLMKDHIWKKQNIYYERSWDKDRIWIMKSNDDKSMITTISILKIIIRKI